MLPPAVVGASRYVAILRVVSREQNLRQYRFGESEQEERMHKVRIAVAVTAALLVAGLMSWNAEATTAAGTAGLPDAIKKYSLVEKAACVGYGKHCPPGYTWVCKPNTNRCWCARC